MKRKREETGERKDHAVIFSPFFLLLRVTRHPYYLKHGTGYSCKIIVSLHIYTTNILLSPPSLSSKPTAMRP